MWEGVPGTALGSTEQKAQPQSCAARLCSAERNAPSPLPPSFSTWPLPSLQLHTQALLLWSSPRAVPHIAQLGAALGVEPLCIQLAAQRAQRVAMPAEGE